MIGRRRRLVVLAAGWTCLAVALLLPAAIFVRHAVDALLTSDLSLLPSARQWMLLLRTLGIAAASTALAVAIALPAAFAIGRMGRTAAAALLTGTVLVPLLMPRMVLAFGWQRILGPHTPAWSDWSPLLRTVWMFAAWAWPIPALLLASGWSTAGRRAYEAAVLVAPSTKAFTHAMLPAISRHLTTSAAVLIILFSTEYTIPHANGVIIAATELLGAVQSADRDTVVRLSWPIAIVAVAALLAIHRCFSLHHAADASGGRVQHAGRSPAAACATVALVIVTAVAPIVALAWRRPVTADFAETITTYGPSIAACLALCIGVGIACSVIGLVVCTVRRRTWLLVAVLLPAVLPGAVVGEIVLTAYKPTDVHYEVVLSNGGAPAVDTGTVPETSAEPQELTLDDLLWWIYNHWPIVLFGLVARYAWIGVLAALLAQRSVRERLVNQAAVDGAAIADARLGLQIRRQWPTLLCGMCVATAGALADVSVASVVAVPGLPMTATIIIEKFHRFETGMLVSLSLMSVACAVPGVLIAVAVTTRRAQ